MMLITAASFASVIQPSFENESSFNYKTQEEAQAMEYCYKGDINQVCDEIYDQEAFIGMDYYNGGHERMLVFKCLKVIDNIVVSYNMKNDYGDNFTVIREIKACK